jgi:hypothetical protein
MTLLTTLNRLVLAVKEIIPNRAQDGWFAFILEGGSPFSPNWGMVSGLLPPLHASHLKFCS